MHFLYVLGVIEADCDDFARRHRYIDFQIVERKNSVVEFQSKPEWLSKNVNLVAAEFTVNQ